MRIFGNNNLNINKITLKPAQLGIAFKGLQADTVEISSKTPSASVVGKKVVLKNVDSDRFSKAEMNQLSKLYNKGEMDFEPIIKFANTTKFPMKSMIELYNMKNDTEDEQFYDKVDKAIKSLGKDNEPVEFKQSVFTPKTQFSLKVDYNKLEKGISNREFLFDNNGEIIAKQDESEETIDENGKKTYTLTVKNLKTDEVRTKTVDSSNNKFDSLEHAKLEKRDNNKNLLYTDEMKPSKVEGTLNYTRTYPDGRVEKMSDASYDEKTGITTIKRNLVSNDGTRTEYLYADDPQGNRLIDYKITDKDGKIIMNNSQTFEKVSDNKFISSNYNDKYEITVNDKELTVKDVRRDLEETINFKKSCKGNSQEIIKLLKQVPGQELFDVVYSLKKINGVSKDDVLKSFYHPIFKKIQTGDDLYVFLHELGHAKDSSTQSFWDKINKENAMCENNEKVRTAYLEERENFNKNATTIERRMIDYFIQAKGHYQGEWGGLGEAIAEANALTSSKMSKETKCLAERNLIFQQHFPKTIAAIKDAMELRNDVYAIEFYGT